MNGKSILPRGWGYASAYRLRVDLPLNGKKLFFVNRRVCDREMTSKLQPRKNMLGRDVTSFISNEQEKLTEMSVGQREIWLQAKTFLGVRDNDVHTLYSYGIACALCDEHPEADREVVLAAILLHDTGWSQVAEEDILEAIAPGGERKDLVLFHEQEGVRIAREVLRSTGFPVSRREHVLDIIREHDSLREAKCIEDAIVKDADKLWRMTPHGVDTIMDWFGLSRERATELIASRVHGHLHTVAGRVMANAFNLLAEIDVSDERIALG